MTPRVVFDCMVLLQAAAKPAGPAGGCFAEVESGRVVLCIGDEVLAEFRDVATRRSVRRNFTTLTDERVAAFLASVERVAVRIDPVPGAVRLARDPKDEKYLNLAVAAGAAIVVSRDNDLLDLMTGTDPDAVKFRTDHPEIAILDPVTFLRILRPTPDA
jgi:putative PIN family toxin of toxin-antitoxin system